jgi:hypothetical protein
MVHREQEKKNYPNEKKKGIKDHIHTPKEKETTTAKSLVLEILALDTSPFCFLYIL